MRDQATTSGVQPLFFGSIGQGLFGQYHPADGGAAQTALLICAPFGHEDLCAYRSLRALAHAAAQAGTATLRFDYPGCGNSPSPGEGTDELHAWVDSIIEAARTLRALSGASQVTVLGVRLGATLATLAATHIAGLNDLIAVAPVVSGRAYLRELKALQMASEAQQASAPNTPDSDSLFESGGFVVQEATRQGLLAIDLSKLNAAPAQRVLLIDRDDLPGSVKWAAHLREHGVMVEQQTMTGYALMMADPHRGQIPDALLDTVLTRLRQTCSWPSTNLGAPGEALGTARPVSGEHHGTRSLDRAAYIGHAPALLSLLSEPADQALQHPAHMGILMLNAGAIRLVGPNGMYVPLARAWANQGHTVLRLDIGGLGDSPPHAGSPDNTVYSDRALADVRGAIAHLQAQAGVRHIVIMGLCSGAYHAFKSAAHGLPVDAVVMINPLTFFWKEGMSLDHHTRTEARVMEDITRHRRVLWHPATWLKLLKGGISPARLVQIGQETLKWACNKAYLAGARLLRLRIKDDLAYELTRIALRSIPMYFVFSDTDPGLAMLHALGGQAVARLQRQRALDISLIEQADHTFTNHAPRTALMRRLDQIVAEMAAKFAAR